MTAAGQVLRAYGRSVVLSVMAVGLIACSNPGSRHDAQAVPVALPATLGVLPAQVLAPAADWVTVYGNAELVALVQEALKANTDLAVAEARLVAADARARSLSAGLLPQVDASAGATRVAGSTREGSATETDRSLQLAAHYEVDFWRAARAARDGATAQARSARFDAQVVRVSLQASVVLAYIGVADLRTRQQSLRDQQAALTEAQDILQARQTKGLAVSAELAGLRAQHAAGAAMLAQLQQQEQDALAALALLLGRGDVQLQLSDARLDALRLPALVGTTPAQLLLRRPDVASAEAALAAADANLAVARAALFPRVVLDLGVALQNPGFNAAVTTLQGTGLSTSLAAAVLQPIFDGGRARAGRDVALADRQAAVSSYRGSILAALIDAQRALAAAHAIAEQLPLQQRTVHELQGVSDILQARSSAGLGDRLALLDAQRAWRVALDQQQQLQAQQLQASVAVYRAFGGGWQVTQQEREP